MSQVKKAGKSIVVSKESKENESVMLSKISCPTIQPVSPMPGVTLGLELLEGTTHLFIRPSLMKDYSSTTPEETPTDCYDIIDCNRGRIYYAWETETSGFGKNRTYTLKVLDFGGRPVLQVTKHSSCLSCFLRWFNCCGSAGCFVTVTTPDGVKLGELKQKYNGWKPKFVVENEYEKGVMGISGPAGGDCCYNCNMMMDVEFPITSMEGDEIGRIDKGSPNPMENMDTFGVRFPPFLGVEMKATLLGCVFAINFMFFDGKKREDVVESYEESERERRHSNRQESHKRDMEALGLLNEPDLVVDETKFQINYERRTSIYNL